MSNEEILCVGAVRGFPIGLIEGFLLHLANGEYLVVFRHLSFAFLIPPCEAGCEAGCWMLSVMQTRIYAGLNLHLPKNYPNKSFYQSDPCLDS